MYFVKIIALLSCFLFWGCYGDRPKLEETLVKKICSEFVKSTGFDIYRSYEDMFNLRFNKEDLEWENKERVFYVVHKGHILSLPIDSTEAEIYMIYSIDNGDLDETQWSFENCMERNIKERISTVYDLCRKKVRMPQVLIEKMKSFLIDGKPSITSIHPGCDCIPGLDMFFYDGEKYHYFDMDKPECIEDDLKNDPRYPEYIEFYNEMTAFIKQDFRACHWENFGNREKIVRECSQYNRYWKNKYPEILGRRIIVNPGRLIYNPLR